jgi:hypothetical protein
MTNLLPWPCSRSPLSSPVQPVYTTNERARSLQLEADQDRKRRYNCVNPGYLAAKKNAACDAVNKVALRRTTELARRSEPTAAPP